MGDISFNDWKNVEIRIGKILEVKDHPEADKLYVLVHYPNQSSPVVAYSRSVREEPETAWQDEARIVKVKLRPGRRSYPQVTVYAPSGLLPEEVLGYRWDASPPGTDVLHFWILALT